MLSVILAFLTYYNTIFFMVLLHLNSFYEFPVYVLSQRAHAPWGCLYKNHRVGKRWKKEGEAVGHFTMVSHLQERQKDWRMVSEVGDGWKLVLGGGWLFSLLGCSSPWWAPLLAAQTGPCALQAWSFTGLLPASVFSGCLSSPLLHDGWRWKSYTLRAGWTHCGQWSEEGKKGWKQCPGTEQSLLQPLSRFSLPTLLYHSPTHILPLS